MRTLVVLCWILAGCASSRFAPASLARTYSLRTRPEAIEIFRLDHPSRKFLEVGTATACCSHDPNLLIGLLRKQAAERGGDALMDFEFSAAGQAAATVIRFE